MLIKVKLTLMCDFKALEVFSSISVKVDGIVFVVTVLIGQH